MFFLFRSSIRAKTPSRLPPVKLQLPQRALTLLCPRNSGRGFSGGGEDCEARLRVSTYRFRQLAPFVSETLDDAYADAFRYACSHDEIRNIAVTGTYASGKSSIVITAYEQGLLGARGDVLFARLAHFRPAGNAAAADVSDSDLEGELVNQLIHAIPKKDIRFDAIALDWVRRS